MQQTMCISALEVNAASSRTQPALGNYSCRRPNRGSGGIPRCIWQPTSGASSRWRPIEAAARYPLPDPDEVAALGVNQGYNATSLTGGGGAWSACAHHRRRLMWWCVVRPPPQFAGFVCSGELLLAATCWTLSSGGCESEADEVQGDGGRAWAVRGKDVGGVFAF